MIDLRFSTLKEYMDLQLWLESLKDRKQVSAWGDAMRDLVRDDLFYLVAFVMSDGAVINRDTGRPLYLDQFYVDYCRDVEFQFENGGGLDMSARGIGKSTVRTKGLNIQRMLKYPNSNGAIFSFLRKAAKKHYQSIKEELEQNSLLKTIFDDELYWDPIAEARNGKLIWSRDEGLRMKSHNRKDFSLEFFAYFDGQPTGSRVDHASLDDVEDHKAIGTEDMLDKLHRGLDATWPLMQGGMEIMMLTNTAYSDGGLVMRYKRMLEDQGKKDHIRQFSAERLDIPGDGPLGGTPQYPYTAEGLQRMYDEMNDKTEYAVQMCGDFTAGEDRTLNVQWLNWYDKRCEDWAKGKLTYICIDPSRGVKDPMAIWVWATGSDKKYHWVNASLKRLDVALPEFMDEIINMISWCEGCSQRLVEIRVEQFGQSTFAEMIKNSLHDRGLFVPVVPCNYNVRTRKFDTGKRDREFEYWAGPTANGHVVFPRPVRDGGPGMVRPDEKGRMRDLVEYFIDNEFKKFPKPVTDNLLDAGSLLFEPPSKLEREIQFPSASYREKRRARSGSSRLKGFGTSWMSMG